MSLSLENATQIIAKKLNLDLVGLSQDAAKDTCFLALCNLCEGRQWEVIVELEESIDILTNSVGQTIMTYIMELQDDTAFENLLERKICVLTTTDNKNFPIHTASELGLVKYVKKLFSYNMLDAKNSLGQMPIHLAAYHGQEDVVSFILENSTVSRSVAQWEYGATKLALSPLAVAIMQGHMPTIDLFLKKPDADWNMKCAGIGNIVHLAIYFQQTRVLERLLTYYFENTKSLIEEENDRNQTPLMLAAYIDNCHALQLLIKKGAKSNTENSDRNTALHWAVMGSQQNAATVLIVNGADVRAENSDRKDPAKLAKKLENRTLFNYLTNIKSAATLMKSALNYEIQKPRVLVFKGGGIKGLAHGGVLQGLETNGMMNSITHIGGTSAGSMIGGLVAVNYSSRQIIEILKTIDFVTFFDHPGVDFKNAVKHPTLGNTFKVLKTIVSTVINPVGAIVGAFKKLYQTTGICKGEVARELMEKFLAEKTGIRNMTFGDLRKRVEKTESGCKHFHVFVTKIGANKEILDINSEDTQWDNFIISDAIRGSMSIPGVFVPHHLHIRLDNGERKPHPGNYVVVDGGMLCNLGIERFDRKRYTTTNYNEADKDYPVYNPRVLGISLFDPQDKIPKPDSAPDNIIAFLGNITSVYFQAEELIRKLNAPNEKRVIEASTCGIGTLKFNLSDDEKLKLIDAGLKSVDEFLKEKGALFNNADFNLETILQPAKPEAVAEIAEVVHQAVIPTAVFSQMNSHDIGTEPGLYIQWSTSSVACTTNKKQWKHFPIGKELKLLDIGKIQATMKCDCCHGDIALHSIALLKATSKLVWADKTKHEKSIEAKNGTAQVVEFKGNHRAIYFENIQPNK